jgi:hypothetical protein
MPPSLSAAPHGATRSEVGRRRLVALGIAVAWLSAFVAILGLRRDGIATHPLALAGHVVVPAILAVAALFTAIRPGRLGLGAPLSRLKALTIAAPAAFAVAAIVGGTTLEIAPTFAQHALICGTSSIGLGLVPLVAAAIGLRRVCVTAAPWRSALIGVGVGLFAAATLGLLCSDAGGFHVLVGHVVPVLLAASAALVLVRRYARVD